MFGKLVRGTTLWPIVKSLPTNIRSPFDTTIWKSRLCDFQFDSCFIDTLIHDIEHGVNIGYTGRQTCLISPIIILRSSILKLLLENSNANLVLIARSDHFSILLMNILSDRRWTQSLKSARRQKNGRSLMTCLGRKANQLTMAYQKTHFPARTTLLTLGFYI